jgi:hypothetical protein
MKKLLLILIAILLLSAAAAKETEEYLVRLDLKSTSEYYKTGDKAALLKNLASRLSIHHISRNYLLAEADATFLKSLPKYSYTVLEALPLTGNWYLVSIPEGLTTDLTPAAGTIITRMDETILLQTELDAFRLGQLTRLPFVKLDFAQLQLRHQHLQSPVPTRVNFGELLNQVNADSIMWYIQSLQDFVTRNAQADNRLQVANWIRDQFIRFGITNAHVEQFFVQGIDQYNVVATIPGTISPDKYIIVGGHHDSITNGSDPLIFAPGADDNASGTVAALEMARVMKANNYQPECSIRFVTFACEEYGLFGSKYHAQLALQQALDIKLMINHDMIAYSTQNPSDWQVRLMPYQGFEGYTAYAMSIVEDQTSLNPYAGSMNSASSDSYPFWQRGFPVVYFFEHEFNPYYHSVNDLVANINSAYVKETIKASTAVCVTFDQIPGAVDSVWVTDTGTGNSLQVSWLHESPETDITSYKIFVTPDEVTVPMEYTATGSPFTVTNLQSGTMYYIGVSAVDNSNNVGLTMVVTGTPNTLPATPFGFADAPALHAVELTWNANQELDLAGYRIYRSTAPEGPFNPVTPNLLTETHYFDQSVADLQYYYYVLTAVDQTGNESVPTNAVRTRALTLNQGILIVDETHNNPGNTVFAPSDAASDQFFDSVLHDFTHTQYDTETQDTLRLCDIGVYSSILWHGNDAGTLSYPSAVRDELKKYILNGGKVFITSYFPTKAFDNNNNYPYTFSSGNFLYDYFGIEHTAYQTSARFRYALPETSGYPPLTVDSLKTVLPLAGHIYNVESIGAKPGAYDIYFYGSDYANTESQGSMNGMAVGVYYNQGCGKAVVLSFPLYNMKQAEVTNLMHHVFHTVFGETVDISDATAAPAAGLFIHRVYPNPFSDYLSLDLQGLKADLPAEVSVYNIKGQRIKTLYGDAAKASGQTFYWDGKDEQGKPVPASVYLIRAEQDNRTALQKVLKLN